MEIRYDHDSSLYRWADDGGYEPPPEMDPEEVAEVPDLADAA